MLIIIAAFTALSGRGKNPASSSEINGTSVVFSGSYDPFADDKYEDEYLKLINEYSDVVIAESNTEDRNYFRETLFVGDSNTEGLAVYNHLSLQYVLGMTGMPIQQVTTNKCMWFVGYEEPVTMGGYWIEYCLGGMICDICYILPGDFPAIYADLSNGN